MITGPFRETAVFIRGDGDKPKTAIVLTLEYRQEQGQWLGECVELGTAAFGASLDEAQEELHDAISLQLNEVERMGFSSDFLREHGVAPILIRGNQGSSWSIAPSAPIGV